MHTPEEIKKHLSYDPETGALTWNKGGRKHKNGDVAGWVNKDGYVELHLEYRKYRAHRVAWVFISGAWPKNVIDHRDGDRANNKALNLRDVTQAENCQAFRNVSPRSKTGVTGVTWNKQKNCYVASRMTNGKSKFLGCFDTIEEASTAYANAENVPETGKTYRPRRASVAPQYPNL